MGNRGERRVQLVVRIGLLLLSRVPAVMSNAASRVVVWNSTILKILGTELALIPLLLGVTYFVQSRKRDFV